MTNEQLRKACELAGLNVIDRGYPFQHQFVANDAKGHDWVSCDPALPAFVASLLVAKVKGLDSFDAELMPTSAGAVTWASTLWPEGGRVIVTMESTIDEGPFVATIRAAVAALEESK